MEDWYDKDTKDILKEELKKENDNRYFIVKGCGNCIFIHKLDTQEKVIVYCSCPSNISSIDTHNKIITEIKIKPNECRLLDMTKYPKWCKLMKYKDLMKKKEYEEIRLSWLDGKEIKKLLKGGDPKRLITTL